MSSNPSTVLSSVSEITADNANNVLQILLRATGGDVSLSSIQHCDSAGLAVLLEAKKRLAKQQAALSYVDVPQQVRELADFLKVSNVLFH